ncbi:MAG: hypothetical protein JSW47_18940 [Phycisphaerales bacterium]|nr:MAG: hypothetical protein JSW47_18940 [Phycisphaerales bacterium]
MSPKKHKSDFLILGVLGAMTAGVLLVLVFWDLERQGHSRRSGIRTTYSTNVDGAIVCYTLLERLGISVVRSEKILLSNVLDKADVLFHLDPIISIGPGEVEDVRAWLISGGVLVCTEIPTELARDMRVILPDKTFRNSPFARRKPGRSRSVVVTYIPAKHRSLPLARDIGQLCFKTGMVFDVKPSDFDIAGGAAEFLFSDDLGARIGTQSMGRGRLIIVSDSSFLANGHIGKSDNSVLAANLVAYALSKAKGNRVVFDEYHLGYGYHETGFGVLSKLLFTSPAGWAVLSLTATGVLFMIQKGRRFGFRRSLETKHRRSKLEYIYGVGSTYRSAGATRLTLKLILTWLKRRATGLVGLAQNASNRAIATELSRRTGADPRQYQEVLDRCDRLLARAGLSERHLLLTMRQLAQIEMEIFNEHRNRK